MEKIINKYLVTLFGVLMTILSFTSCTDQDDVEISYGTTLNVTAAHIFDSFYKTMEDDFSLNGSAGTWTLNLHSYIYDSNGELIDMCEESSNDLSKTMTHELKLDPGKYTIISVAEFDGTYGGVHYKFWNISNESKLSELQIQESETVCSSAMETLGINTYEFEVADRTQNIEIDIKPVTGLVEMIIWDNDFSGSGKNGFSFKAPYINDLTICSPQLKQVVKFDGNTPIYDYGIQAVRYPMQTHSPRYQAAANGATEILGYRALLPDNDKKFYWELNTIPGAGELLFTDGNDFQMSDMTENSVNIVSGKQYVMDLLLDAFYLFLDDYDPSIDMFTRIEKYMSTYNSTIIKKALDVRYDKCIGMSKQQFESYVKLDEFYTSDNTVNYFGTGLVNYVSVVFDNETYSTIKQIMLTWDINTPKDYDVVSDCLSELYTPLENGSTSTVKQFINADTFDKATVGISWSLNNYCLSFDRIEK